MELGFPAIDEDHERLLSLAAEVEPLIASAGPMDRVRGKFHELVEYSQAHFSREEAHMEKCGYAGLAGHSREHQEVAEWLVHIEESLAEDGPNASVAATDETVAFFKAWIEEHLTTFDQPMVRFMLSRSLASQPVSSIF